jgi:hypothetical protein
MQTAALASSSLGARPNAATGKLALPQHVRLLQDAHSQLWWAVNDDFFAEASPLPRCAEGDAWELDFTESGMAFLADSGPTVWFSNVSKHYVLKAESGATFVVGKAIDGKVEATWMEELVASHWDMSLCLDIPQLVHGTLSIHLSTFCFADVGASVWLSLHDIYDHLELGIHPGTASAWFNKRKASWQKLTDKLDLGSTSVRQGVSRGNATSRSDMCTPFHGLSCHALFALLATWTSSCKGQSSCVQDPVARGKLLSLLQVLLQFLGSDLVVRICLDIHVRWIPGVGVCGKFPCALLVRNNVVDMTPFNNGQLHDAPFPPEQQFADVADACGNSPTLEDLLRVSATLMARGNMWLFKQLVWALGALLDQELLTQASHLGNDAGGGDDQAVCLSANTVLGHGDRHVGTELRKYVKKGIQVMKGKQFYSCAPDASKIGNQALLLCPMVENQSGLAMWAAPQVISSSN